MHVFGSVSSQHVLPSVIVVHSPHWPHVVILKLHIIWMTSRLHHSKMLRLTKIPLRYGDTFGISEAFSRPHNICVAMAQKTVPVHASIPENIWNSKFLFMMFYFDYLYVYLWTWNKFRARTLTSGFKFHIMQCGIGLQTNSFSIHWIFELAVLQIWLDFSSITLDFWCQFQFCNVKRLNSAFWKQYFNVSQQWRVGSTMICWCAVRL